MLMVETTQNWYTPCSAGNMAKKITPGEKKAWFEGAREISKEIDSLCELRERMIRQLTACTAKYSKTPAGKGSSGPHKFDSLGEISFEITQSIESLKKRKAETIRAINTVPDLRIRRIMRDRYIENMSWQAIAEREKYSIRQVRRLNAEGIEIARVSRRQIDSERCP